MNIIKLLNKICAVNLSEPCRDDLKRLSDENIRLVKENEELKNDLRMAIEIGVEDQRKENRRLSKLYSELKNEIKNLLTHPSYNSDEKMCEIKLLIDEVKK